MTKTRSHTPNRSAYLAIGKVNQVPYELIRMLGFYPITIQVRCGKVSQIKCNDHIGAAFDRGSKDMAVIRIGQGKSFDERLVVFDQAVAHVRIHERSRARQLGFSQIGTFQEKIPAPFRVDPLRPLRAEQIGKRKLK